MSQLWVKLPFGSGAGAGSVVAEGSAVDAAPPEAAVPVVRLPVFSAPQAVRRSAAAVAERSARREVVFMAPLSAGARESLRVAQ
jgi:hypothetical protein